MTINGYKLDHIQDLDRGRLAHVISQRKKDLPADPIFLGLPSDETYAINSVARFLRTKSKVKVFGDNHSSYKAVFTNLGQNPEIHMNAKYIGVRSAKIAEKSLTQTDNRNFHPLIEDCQIKNFISMDHAEVEPHLTNVDIVVGNEPHFASELMKKLLQVNPATLKLVIFKVKTNEELNTLSNLLPSDWSRTSYEAGTVDTVQNNFLAWNYDLTMETIHAIVENIHPIH